jgi:hypothetical protein
MPKSKAKTQTKPARPPRGQVGPQTYDHVRKLVAEKNVTLLKAFNEVAKATGRKASTVQVTYYRIARQKRGGRRSVATGRRGRPGRPKGHGSAVQTALSQVSAAIRGLEAIIVKQGREITRLTEESKLAARIRQALRE